jgi:cytochrome P450
VVDPLAPVEAGKREDPAAPARRGEVDPEVAEKTLSRIGDLELPARRDQGAALDQGRRETDAHAAGQMVVPGAGGAIRSARHGPGPANGSPLFSSAPGENVIARQESFPADPLAAVNHPDPYPYYAHLVAEAPLVRDEALGLWVASSAAAVTSALSDDELCRVRPPAEPVPRALVGSPAGEIFSRLVRMTDGRDRCPLKQAVSAALASAGGPAAARESRRWARVLAAEIDPEAHPGAISSFAFALPAYVVLSLLGVPADRLAGTVRWAGAFAQCLAPAASPGQIEEGKVAAGRLLDLFRSQTDRGLLATLSREVRRFGREDPDAVVANAVGFLFQAYEATAGLIGNTLLAFAAHREICEQARTTGGLVGVVKEVQRYDPSVQNTRRFLAGPGIIAGQEMQKGDVLLVVLAAANRDPAANPHPDRFDPTRQDRRLFTFGAGPHACPGEALATTIAAAGVEQLLRSGVDPERLAATVTYRRSANIRIPLFGGDDSGEP